MKDTAKTLIQLDLIHNRVAIWFKNIEHAEGFLGTITNES